MSLTTESEPSRRAFTRVGLQALFDDADEQVGVRGGEPAARALAGLLVCGVGVANLYLLSLALTLEAAPAQHDRANARSQLLGGLSVVVAPFLLGILAHRLGLTAAFGTEPVLVLACWLRLVAGLVAVRRTLPARGGRVRHRPLVRDDRDRGATIQTYASRSGR